MSRSFVLSVAPSATAELPPAPRLRPLCAAPATAPLLPRLLSPHSSPALSPTPPSPRLHARNFLHNFPRFRRFRRPSVLRRLRSSRSRSCGCSSGLDSASGRPATSLRRLLPLVPHRRQHHQLRGQRSRFYAPEQYSPDQFQIGPDQIEALYQYAKFQFECGNYSGAADFLYQYRALCTNSERSLSALWGKLAAEILMQNWDVAQEELNRLKEIIDSKNFSSPINQLHSRIWLMHWSLFIFFNHENGKNGIIDLFFQDRYLNAIQTNAPHLLRYLAAAVVVNKRRRNMLKELIKVIQQEQQTYKDPITEFLECLYVNYDFAGAQQKLIDCEQVILNDPFLGKRIEEGNFITVPLRDEFLENARLFIFETYCRIHRCIDIGMLAEKMNMTYDEAELWIKNLSSKLDAKIDSVTGTLIMTTNHVNVHQQIIESMKNLNARTYMLAKSLVDPGHAAAQQAAR